MSVFKAPAGAYYPHYVWWTNVLGYVAALPVWHSTSVMRTTMPRPATEPVIEEARAAFELKRDECRGAVSQAVGNSVGVPGWPPSKNLTISR